MRSHQQQPVWAKGHERRQGKWRCFFVSRGNKGSCITVVSQKKERDRFILHSLITFSHFLALLPILVSQRRSRASPACASRGCRGKCFSSHSRRGYLISRRERERESRQSPVSEWCTTSSRVHTQPVMTGRRSFLSHRIWSLASRAQRITGQEA